MGTSRREFLAVAGGCAARIAAGAALLPPVVRRRWGVPFGRVVAAEPFGRLEQLADGVWGLISTPLAGDLTTVCNGGLIAGRNGVLAIEGFMQPAGAQWLSDRCRELTGQWPSHVLVTHYHSDHTNGVSGYFSADRKPTVHSTGATRDQVRDRNKPADPAREHALAEALVIDAGAEGTIDLGGRTVTVLPRAGHTASDVALVVEEANLVFGGDLLWNGMFPNYVDTTPTLLARSVEGLRRAGTPTYVPGHGPVASTADFERFRAFLAEIERQAREGRRRGIEPAALAQEYTVPAALGEWTLFNKSFIETAFKAWYRELGPG